MASRSDWRAIVAAALDWDQAHATFARAVDGIPPDLRGRRPEGFPHSVWELVEHIRLAQRDLLDFMTAEHYEDAAAADPRIDALRAKMVVVEEPRYTADYLDPSRRSIANAVQVFFRDRTATERVEVEYPIGHPRRRREGLPLLEEKLAANLGTRFAPARARRLLELCLDHERFSATPVPLFMELLAD